MLIIFIIFAKKRMQFIMKQLILLFLSILFVFNPTVASNNEKPFVIPELKQWKGDKGSLTITSETKIVYPKGNDELKRIAQLFSDDYYTMFNIRLATSDSKAGKNDIVFKTNKNDKLGKEGYHTKIGNQVEISASQSIGVYWATRTILQISEQSEDKSLPKGEITDYPDYEMRGFMLDCGRKFIPMHFLRDYVKFMSYYKMNAFHIHLNDNGFEYYFQDDWNKTYAAFRLESDTYPGLTAQDGSYSKKEFIDLQILAEEYYVEIVPEIDVPAHSLAFSRYKPEIGSEEYGIDHLDLFKPETYEFLDGLFHEYLSGDNPVFRGSKVHIGTDEYSNKKKEVVEKFRYFTDYYIKKIESYGKQACVWGALTHAKGDTPVKSENVLMWAWYNGYAEPVDMIEQGYRLISIPDGLVYIVPNAGYYYDYLNTKHLYENWTPATIGKDVFAERHPQIAGGMFAVWNDHVGNGISTKDIHHRVLPAMKTMATKMWTGKETTIPFDKFNTLKNNLSEAPGINIEGKIGKENTTVFEKTTVSPNEKNDIVEIGYNYTVSFKINGKKEDRGTILFKSPDTEFYLSDPIKGLLGFSRDGYLYTFDYSVKDGKAADIKICGDSKSTRFYLNGKLVEELNSYKMYFKNEKRTMNYIQTLVFPLQQTGSFKSKITGLKVQNFCDEVK